MLYLLTIVFLFLNLLFKNSKYLLFLDFGLLFILLGFSYGPYDTMIFIDRFVNYKHYAGFTEILFNNIINLGHNLGMDYRTFLLVTSFIELLLIFFVIKKNTKNYCYVIALFILYPMILMFEQLRFFMAFTIVIVGAIDPIINKSKFYKIKAIIFIIIASMIHSSCIFYMIFIFIDNINIKKLFIITIIASLFLSSMSLIKPLMNSVSQIIGEEKVAIVGTEIERLNGNFGRSFLVIYIIIMYYIQYLYMKNDKFFYNNKNKDDIEFIERTLKFNIACLMCIPLTMLVSPAFYRMPQSVTILNYISFSKYIKSHGTKIRKKEFIFIFINCIYALSLIILLVHSSEAIGLIITPFFEQNAILKF